jgi:ABC-type nitrate/sulfonate/bicarbonate transport system permease component
MSAAPDVNPAVERIGPTAGEWIRALARRAAHTPAIGVALIALLLLLWQVSAVYWTDSPNWPPLTDIAKAGVSGFASGELAVIFGSSLYRIAVGYLIGVACALGVGLLMANIRLVQVALDPIVELLRPIPIPAIVPPLILLLGVDDALKIFVIAFSVFFPVLVNTVSGVWAVDPVAIDVARTLRVGRLRAIARVIVPASLPYILAGMRISLALALVVTVVAEMIAGSSGIGYYLVSMQYAMRASDMYAAILVLAALGYALNRGFLIIERRCLHWYSRSATGRGQ